MIVPAHRSPLARLGSSSSTLLPCGGGSQFLIAHVPLSRSVVLTNTKLLRPLPLPIVPARLTPVARALTSRASQLPRHPIVFANESCAARPSSIRNAALHS